MTLECQEHLKVCILMDSSMNCMETVDQIWKYRYPCLLNIVLAIVLLEVHSIYDSLYCIYSVASLGWVTPGAATEGVTPLFFPQKPGNLFLLIAVTITIAFHCFHSGVTPSKVSPHTFFTCPTSFLHYSL